MPSYFVESWKYVYESRSGRMKALALNLWEYDGTHIKKLGEYIYWPFASDEEPNYWATTSPILRTPVVSDGKYYKTDRFRKDGHPFETLEDYPDAKRCFEEKGVVEAH
jgi:hypothetical protein